MKLMDTSVYVQLGLMEQIVKSVRPYVFMLVHCLQKLKFLKQLFKIAQEII